MIEQVVNASNSTIELQDEQFLVVVDLLVFRPELDLQVQPTVRLFTGVSAGSGDSYWQHGDTSCMMETRGRWK